MRIVALALVAGAIAAAVATAVLILRIPDPPGPNDGNEYAAEVEFSTYTKRNAEQRRVYIWAGGIVVVTLLGSALVLSRHPSR